MSNSVNQALFRDSLLNIFSYLDPNSVLKTTKVCKVWHQVSESKELWKELAQQKGIVDVENYKDAVLKLEKMEKSFETGEIKLLQTLQNDETVYSLFLTKDTMFSGHISGLTSSDDINCVVKIWQKKEGSWRVVEKFVTPSKGMINRLTYSEGKLSIQYSDEKQVFEKKNGKWIQVETINERCKKNDDHTIVGKYKVKAEVSKANLVISTKEIKVRSVQENTDKYGQINTVQYFDGQLFTGTFNGKIKIWGPKETNISLNRPLCEIL